MKKRVLILVTLAVTTALIAKSYTKEDRIADMQKMAKAMLNIQNGFFYNNFDMIKLGGVEVADTILNVEPPLSEKEEKDVMTHFMNNKVKMTRNIKKRIRRKMQHMIESFSRGDKVQALQDFSDVTKNCMKCHVKLRKW